MTTQNAVWSRIDKQRSVVHEKIAATIVGYIVTVVMKRRKENGGNGKCRKLKTENVGN